MSFLIRRNLPWAWAGWRDLDAEHIRPDENPIQKPWASVNTHRTVQLLDNQLVIADAFETLLEFGGVSFEQQPYTENWGCEYDLNIDGNILQQQFFGAGINYSWTNVGFFSLVGTPMILIWRDVLSAVNTIRVSLPTTTGYTTLATTGTLSGLMNKTWYKFRVMFDNDHLIRIYVNDILVLQYWLREDLAISPGRRALNFINQTSAPSYQKNFRLFDQPSQFQTKLAWNNLVVSDEFNRENSATVGNGWTQLGADSGIVNNTFSTTGTTDGSKALIRDTGVTHGTQRIETIVGGNIAPNTVADSSLAIRVDSTGSNGLSCNFYSSRIYLSLFSGGAFYDYVFRDIAVANGDSLAFSANGDFAWIELNGTVVLMAELSGTIPATNSYAGLRVERTSGTNSPSFNSVRILTPF